MWGAVEGAVCGSCVGVSCVGELCGELCGGMHTSHQMVQAYTHHCLQYSSTAPPLPFLSCPLPPPSPFLYCPLTLLLPVACGGTSQDDIDEGGIIGDGEAGNKRDVTDGDDTSAEGQEDDGDHTPSRSQSSKHRYFVCVRVHVCKWPCYVGCVHECAATYN